jgi:CheY-like chemotaxis protein
MPEGTVSSIPQKKDLLKGNGEMVLMVEDDLAVQNANRSLLDSYHYKILIASSRIKAVNIYQQYQQEIKIVLIDIMMPNMDGITAIHTIATMNPQVKIVAMSGLSLPRDAALAAGALVFLPKPYTLEELVRSLYELVKIIP